jgi:hypothetical protein
MKTNNLREITSTLEFLGCNMTVVYSHRPNEKMAGTAGFFRTDKAPSAEVWVSAKIPFMSDGFDEMVESLSTSLASLMRANMVEGTWNPEFLVHLGEVVTGGVKEHFLVAMSDAVNAWCASRGITMRSAADVEPVVARITAELLRPESAKDETKKNPGRRQERRDLGRILTPSHTRRAKRRRAA